MVETNLHAKAELRDVRSQLSDECLVAGKHMRDLLGGCSDMHIWRLLNSEKHRALAFPRPIKINDRNYWRLGALRQWIRDRETQSLAASPNNDARSSRGRARRLKAKSRRVGLATEQQ